MQVELTDKEKEMLDTALDLMLNHVRDYSSLEAEEDADIQLILGLYEKLGL